MKIQHAERAIVDPAKITRYLLDPTNPRNQDKHGFFLQFGFTRQRWRVMVAALRDHAMRYDVVSEEHTAFGVNYRVVGPLTTPDGRNPIVRSVWIVLHDGDVPRFVTAVPHERRRQ